MMSKDLLSRSKHALLTGDLPQAEELCTKFINSHPESTEAQLLLGTVLTRLGKLQSAQKTFETLLRNEPENPDALLNSAMVYQKRGKLKTALQAAQKAYSVAEDRADIIFDIGNIHKQLGELNKAEKIYRLAIEKDPGFVPTYNNLALLLTDAGKNDEAETILKQGLSRDPNHPGMHFNLAGLYQKNGKNKEAEEELRHALKINPGWEECLLALGNILRKKDADEAGRIYRRVLDLSPDSLDAKSRLGEISIEKGRIEDAEVLFTGLLSEHPEYTPAAINLAAVYYEQNRVKEAEKLLRDYQKKDPDNIELRLLLGNILLESAKYNEAFSHIRFVLDRDENESRAWFAMARQFSLSGKKDRALNAYRKGLKLSPEADEARLQLALLLKSIGRTEEAITECEYIYRNHTGDFRTSILLSELYITNKNYRAAADILERLSAEAPDDIDLLQMFAKTAKDAGFTEKAFKAAERLASLTGEDTDSFDLDSLNANLNLYDEMADRYAEDYSSNWKKNLRALSKTMTPEPVHEEASFLFDGIQDIGDEYVPILDVGGIDPVILIDEQEEYLTITDEDEFFPPEEEEEPPEDEAEKHEEAVADKAIDQPRPPLPQAPGAAPAQPRTPVPPQAFTVKLETPPIVIRQAPPLPPPPEPEEEILPQQDYNPEDDEDNEEDNLFGYLDKLTDYLPPDKKNEYFNSDARLKIAALKAKMDGDPGLFSRLDGISDEISDVKLTTDKIGNTLNFMTKMSESLPDAEIAVTLSSRLKNIISRLEVQKEELPDDK